MSAIRGAAIRRLVDLERRRLATEAALTNARNDVDRYAADAAAIGAEGEALMVELDVTRLDLCDACVTPGPNPFDHAGPNCLLVLEATP